MVGNAPVDVHPLRLWLLQHRTTESAFAEAVGVDVATISRLVCGKRPAGRRTLMRVSDATGISLDVLVRWPTPPPAALDAAAAVIATAAGVAREKPSEAVSEETLEKLRKIRRRRRRRLGR